MNTEYLVNYFNSYGLLFIFIVVFIEHLNMPGVPASIVMPAIGAIAAQKNDGLMVVIAISVLGAILGSIAFYFIGYYIGNPIVEKLSVRAPKTKKYIDKILLYSDMYGNKALFICRLIPVMRTVVSLISGVLKIDFIAFVTYSTLGITIWNFVFISFGYYGTQIIIK